MSLAAVFNYFANSLWQVPLLALCCGCGLRLLRASAGVRYVVWMATLLLCVGVPLRGARTDVAAAVEVSADDEVVAGALLHTLPRPSLPFYEVRIEPRTRDLLAGFYLLLTGIFLLRLLRSHGRLRRLVRASTPYVLSSAEREKMAGLGGNASLRVLHAPHATPMVAGILQPVILLPAELLAGPPEPLRAVLAHELAHLHRRDPAVNLMLRLIALPVAYHPATAMVHRQIQHARELLCDAVAASALPSPAAYAHVLLSLAQRLIHPGSDPTSSSAGLFQRTSNLLEERMMHLIAPPAPLRTASRLLRLSAGMAVFSAAAATVSFVHLTPLVLAAEHPAQAVAATQTPAAAATIAPTPQTLTKPAATNKSALTKTEQNDLKQASADLANAAAELQDLRLQQDLKAANTAEIKQRIDELRAQLDSPEFRQQIAQAAAEGVRASEETAALRKQMDAMRRQLNSPEFHRQIQAATDAELKAGAMTPPDISQLVAEARQQALVTHTTAMPSAQGSGTPRVSARVMAGLVVSKVAPVYPPDAKATRIAGSVVLHAIIGQDGTVSALEVVSGPQELRASALEAVRQWVYKPYLLNGQPTAVETTVTVTYSFGG